MRNVHFEIQPSRFLHYWHNVLPAIVAIIIVILPLSLFAKACFLTLTALSFFLTQTKIKKNKFTPQAIKYSQNERWHIFMREEKLYAKLLRRNYICDFFLILQFEIEQDRHCYKKELFLLKQQLHPSDWQNLQMIVRMGRY